MKQTVMRFREFVYGSILRPGRLQAVFLRTGHSCLPFRILPSDGLHASCLRHDAAAPDGFFVPSEPQSIVSRRALP